MVKRKGLGKGLGALIPEKEILENNDSDFEKIQQIKIDKIEASDNNPRKNFDDETINSLSKSIKLYGILQPLVLIKNDEKYKIVAGERRYRAAKIAGLETVPAIIRELNDKDKDMISMIENIQREDLNPYEEAQAYENIMKIHNLTQEELSNIIGKSRTYIANIVRLLSLDDFTISELEKGNITSSQGRALLGIKDIFERKKYLEMLIKKEITVNEIEKRSSKKEKKIIKKDVFIKDIEDRLKESLGAKVDVKKSNNKWKVSIEFANDEQIEEFLERYGLGE
ncbi:ParB/RepB/Spo0J family partition protein [Helcococcus ovis]|uniref:ParB/RepB/Spo0J family partition protein n=1 Tax=Helcococcus ovis TaxID=72026 RepID=A0A4R9C5J4_9FIRM|nr:ParB/RepB/Spo0J family partition protein [Helcococcus ovis]TFF65357.1 ParB/RepB/Spo0J family partition protein [Helcococcus ovis]TFF67686.1 ParB/RepB/Spo0J family partition protein [Helcococcus ovis]